MKIWQEPKFINDTSGKLLNSNDNFDINCEPVYFVNKLQNYSQPGPKNGYRGDHSFIAITKIVVFQICLKQYLGSNLSNYGKWKQKTNLLGKSGKATCCLICTSIYYWANKLS